MGGPGGLGGWSGWSASEYKPAGPWGRYIGPRGPTYLRGLSEILMAIGARRSAPFLIRAIGQPPHGLQGAPGFKNQRATAILLFCEIRARGWPAQMHPGAFSSMSSLPKKRKGEKRRLVRACITHSEKNPCALPTADSYRNQERNEQDLVIILYSTDNHTILNWCGCICLQLDLNVGPGFLQVDETLHILLSTAPCALQLTCSY